MDSIPRTPLRSAARVCALAAFLFDASQAACAASDTLALDRVSVSFGTFVSDVGASASGDGSVSNSGTEIDFDRDFDTESSSSLDFFELAWRPLDRHELRISYFDDSLSGERTIDREIRFEDEVYPVGADVRGELGLRVIDASYTFWALLKPKDAFGITLGVVRVDADVSLEGTITLSGNTVAIEGSASDDLPAPKLGLNYAHAFNDKWRVTADVGTFERSVGSIDGRIWDANVGLEWFPWKHVGFVLRQAYTRIDAELERDEVDGAADITFNGTQALIRARW